MSAQVIEVGAASRRYHVHAGPGLLHEAGALIAPLLKRKITAIVTDETVARALAPQLEDALNRAGIAHMTIALEPGEATKSFSWAEQLSRALLSAGIERGDLVIALGGGVIGDLTGFVCGMLRRGTGFVQIPTTLLAQVDSSVGGKTAINVPEGKNLVGLFHQPRLVIADTQALATLSPREMRAGYAEVVKYGVLGDAGFFDWLEQNGARVLAHDADALTHAVGVSIAMKAGIVARDETEQGERALLNLGHTFGHALEAATGFSGRLLHGEGVAIGMVLALRLSAALGHCDPQAAPRLAAHLKAAGLPSRIADIPGERPETNALLHHMAQDKKVEGGKLTFILARRIGETFIAKGVDMDAVGGVLGTA